MMVERGTVLGHEGALARVEIGRSEACEACETRGCCVARADEAKMVLLADDPLGISPGTQVEVGVPGKAVLKATALVYGMPLLMLIAGLAVVSALGGSQAVGAAVGIAGAAAAMAAGGAVSRKKGYRPKILRALPPVSS